jgi:hypothetical protein
MNPVWFPEELQHTQASNLKNSPSGDLYFAIFHVRNPLYPIKHRWFKTNSLQFLANNVMVY